MCDQIKLQCFNGKEWETVSTWSNEWMAWVSLGGNDYNYRTVDENGNILTEKIEKAGGDYE